ncbi:hypothetical protein GGS26DRAFT_203350 [Hypomontagnella submonticulosa]|nr:hypothetical protein GGS26DRAFT_203350 [Hypomontagnella submonticulosa]
MASPVPTPRQFITSLIESLASIPLPTASSAPTTSSTETNPLKLIPPTHRPLLTTLYALYPSILLPALDLLDRRLATRIVVRPLHLQHDTIATTTTPSAATETPGHGKEKREEGDAAAATPSPSFFLVRSAQPQHPRRGHGDASAKPGLSYVVRLDAWNCTCAAFAFAAFPRGEESYIADADADAASVVAGAGDEGGSGGGLGWEFGALSRDGTEGSGMAGVPCCKHLLACVLAERWRGLLGGYVDERVVGRQEAAGLVADI